MVHFFPPLSRVAFARHPLCFHRATLISQGSHASASPLLVAFLMSAKFSPSLNRLITSPTALVFFKNAQVRFGNVHKWNKFLIMCDLYIFLYLGLYLRLQCRRTLNQCCYEAVELLHRHRSHLAARRWHGKISREGYAPVRIHINDFAICQDEFPITKTTSIADYTGVKAITLAFFTEDGSQQYSSTQLRADSTTYTDFGDFECTLPIGTYTMVVLGYGSGTPITLTNATTAAYTADKVRETFVNTQTVEVSSTARPYSAAVSTP